MATIRTNNPEKKPEHKIPHIRKWLFYTYLACTAIQLGIIGYILFN